MFIKLGLYRAIFRYSGISSLSSSVVAVFLYGVVFFSVLILAALPGVPRSIGILQPIFFFSLVFGNLAAAAQLLNRADAGEIVARKVVIYGAGEAGAQASQSLAMTKEYCVCAFLDDDPTKHGQRLNGVEIFPRTRRGSRATFRGVRHPDCPAQRQRGSASPDRRFSRRPSCAGAHYTRHNRSCARRGADGRFPGTLNHRPA